MTGKLCSEQTSLFGSRSITIDHRRRVVTFAHCHTRPRFWSITKAPEVVCRFDEVLDVHSQSRRGRTTLSIITARGTAYMSDNWSRFSEIRAALCDIARATSGAPAHEHPEVLYKWIPLAVAAVVIWLVIEMGWIR